MNTPTNTNVNPVTGLQKHAGGRPLKFLTPEELETKALAHIEEMKARKEPITITGLALALDTDRETLMNYANRDEFTASIKKIRTIAENYAETAGFKGRSPIFAIFALKNFGWKDKQEVEHSIKSIGNVLNELESDDNPILDVPADSVE